MIPKTDPTSIEPISLICPKIIRAKVLSLWPKRNISFYTKKEAIDILCGSGNDQDTIVYAQKHDISWAASKNKFKEFSTLFNPKKPIGLKPVDDLVNEKKIAIDEGCFRIDRLERQCFLKLPCVILGYDSKADGDLFRVLKAENIAYSLADTKEWLKTEIPEKTALDVALYTRSYEEISWVFSQIASDLDSGRSDAGKLQIVCPQSYLQLLSQLAPYYGLKLDLMLSSWSATGLVTEFLANHPNCSKEDIYSLIADCQKNAEIFSPLLLKLYETESLVEFCEDICGSLRPELRREIFNSVFDSKKKFDSEYRGISVLTSLSDIKPDKELWILGLSDALISTKKDNTMIPDMVKPLCSYAQTAVEKNMASENSLRISLSLADKVHFSRSLIDSEKRYGTPFFVSSPRFVYKEMSQDELKGRVYVTRDSEERDLRFLFAMGADRFVRLAERDKTAADILCAKPVYASLYGDYDPSFDMDQDTSDFYRKVMAAYIARKTHSKNDGFSYSSINTYYKNPFDWWCSTLMGIRSPDSFLSLIGVFLHSLAEERKDFDLKSHIDECVSQAEKNGCFPIDGMIGPNCYAYLLQRNYRNTRDFVLPSLEINEKIAGVSLLKIQKTDEQKIQSQDEFSPKHIKLFGDLVMQASYDALMVANEKDPQGRTTVSIVDYKSTPSTMPKDYEKHFNGNEVFFGRSLQLPVYLMTLPVAIKDYRKNDQFASFDPEPKGAFLCAIRNKFWSDKEKNCGTFYGMKLESEYSPFKAEQPLISEDENDEEKGKKTKPESIFIDKSYYKVASGSETIPEDVNLKTASAAPRRANMLAMLQNYQIPGFAAKFGIKDDSQLSAFLPWGFLNPTNPLTYAQIMVNQCFMACLQFTDYLRNGRLTAKDGRVSWFPYYPEENNTNEAFKDISYQSSTKYNRHLRKNLKSLRNLNYFKDKAGDYPFKDFDQISTMPSQDFEGNEDFQHYMGEDLDHEEESDD